jgi:hypothetical protein
MSRKLSYGLALSLALGATPLMADYSDVQLVGTTVANQHVTVQVGNPNASAESVRIQVVVRVADGSTEVLTTSTVTVAGSSTSSVSVSAANTIVAIIDDPEPISP